MYSEIKTLSEHIQRVQNFCEKLFSEDNSLEDLSFNNEKNYTYNEIIKNNDLPKFVRKNLKYLFKLKIENDLNSLKQKEYYNFEDEDSIELFSSLNTFFLERCYLKSSQLKKIIVKIINLHFNFLLRPRFTLQSIFGEEESLEIKKVNNKLANFYEYTELIEEIKLELLNISFDSEIIAKSQFKTLIKEIDEKLILEMNANEFLDLVVPIFDLFNIIDENTNENLVPTEALMLFFDDKNLTPIVELLENKYNYDNLIYIDKTTLLSLLIEIIDSISVSNEFNLDENEIVNNEIVNNEIINNEEEILDLSEFEIENNLDEFGEISVIDKNESEFIKNDETAIDYNFDLVDDFIDSSNLESNDETENEFDKDFDKDFDFDFSEINKIDNLDIALADNSKPISINVEENINFDNLEDLLNLEHKDYNNIDFNNLDRSLMDLESQSGINSEFEIDGIDNLEDLDKLI